MHLGSARRRDLVGDLAARRRGWLPRAAGLMGGAVTEDWEDWRKAGSRDGAV